MYNFRVSATLTNCILWGNTAISGGNQIYNYDSTPVIGHSNIQGSGGSDSWDGDLGTDLGGNIDADPLFIDAINGDFHLQSGSPCIDAGDNTVPNLPATDFEGDDRRIDDPLTPDTGSGTAPIVDMGVDEYVAAATIVDIFVELQGSSRPESGWEIPVTVTIGSTSYGPITTSKSGDTAVCQITDVTPGTHDITITSEHTLTNIKRGVTITAGTNTEDMGTLLEGDCNGDGTINISDFGILAVAFMKSEGQEGFDARADFDRNGIVNISDFGLLAVNFMNVSPVEVE